MRTLRKTALALTTAAAVSLTGTAVASAQEETTTLEKIQATFDKLGKDIKEDLNKPATGTDVFGDKSFLNDEKAAEKVPAWLKGVVGTGIAAAIVAGFTWIIAPFFNFLKANGFLG